MNVTEKDALRTVIKESPKISLHQDEPVGQWPADAETTNKKPRLDWEN